MTTLDVLLSSAIAIGAVHSLIGIDHSLPFVVLGRAQRWPLRRTLGLVTLCGVGHVLSSALLGVVGIALGISVVELAGLEQSRGSFAAWLLVLFGLAYAGWSLARRRRQQRHAHDHGGGVVHSHAHSTHGTHRHRHDDAPRALTAWGLFIVFVLGPCEPLIPLLMVPALDLGWLASVQVAAAFAVTTIGTMVVVVAAGYYGMKLPVFEQLERHAHVVAGVAIALSGLAVAWLGI